MTPLGQSVFAICDEFDWKPCDEEIYAFVTDMIEKPEQIAFMVLIKKYRDDREGLFKEFEDLKKQNGDIDKSE
jgi:23S rRNA C2498 (ribose-2'-O)-methylase RlmM